MADDLVGTLTNARDTVQGWVKSGLEAVDKYVPSIGGAPASNLPKSSWTGQDGQQYKSGPNGPTLATPTGLNTIKNFEE